CFTQRDQSAIKGVTSGGIRNRSRYAGLPGSKTDAMVGSPCIDDNTVNAFEHPEMRGRCQRIRSCSHHPEFPVAGRAREAAGDLAAVPKQCNTDDFVVVQLNRTGDASDELKLEERACPRGRLGYLNRSGAQCPAKAACRDNVTALFQNLYGEISIRIT